jgi:hypothetical protein
MLSLRIVNNQANRAMEAAKQDLPANAFPHVTALHVNSIAPQTPGVYLHGQISRADAAHKHNVKGYV